MGNAMEKMPEMPAMPAMPEGCKDCGACETARKQLDRICLDHCPRLCEEKKPSGELAQNLELDGAEPPEDVKPEEPPASAPAPGKLCPEEETNVSTVAVTEPEGESKLEPQRRGPPPMDDAPGEFEEDSEDFEEIRRGFRAPAPAKPAPVSRSASPPPAKLDPRLTAWLQRKGYMSIDTPKRVRRGVTMGTVYPLHTAAEENDRVAVAMLIDAGAKASQTNTRGKTALDVANSSDRNGSHAGVVNLLEAALSCEQ